MLRVRRTILVITASFLGAVLLVAPTAASDAANEVRAILDADAVGASRDVEETIWYQGFLADVDTGDPINGSVTIGAGIYDAESGGTFLWGPEIHSGVVVTEGWFNIELGSIQTLIDFDDPPYYLGLVIEGETLDSRMKLASVPTAFHSADLDLPFQSIINTTISDPAFYILQTGMGTGIRVEKSEETSGYSGIFSEHDGSGAAIYGYNTSTGVGIRGTSAGGLAGQFDGDVSVSGNLETSTFKMTDGAAENYVLASDADGDASWTSLTFLGDGDWTVSGSDMYSMVSGNVGIGDSTPEVKLDVNGDAEITGDLNMGWDGYAIGLTRELTVNTAALSNSWSASPSPYNRTYLDIPGDGYIDVMEQLYIRDESNDQWVAFNSETQYVGIGTSAPIVPLQVVVPGSSADGRCVSMTSWTTINTNNDVLEVIAPSGSSTGCQIIEAQTGSDVEFRVNGNGEVYADGSFTGGGADFAEMIRASDGAASIEVGDVLVIDSAGPRSIARSREAHSSLVAGVYSTKPGFVGSTREWDVAGAEDTDAQAVTRDDMAARHDEVPMAVVGIVPCKVSAENGPIAIGDLLVTSGTPGHAMRAENPRAGTILGKALEELPSGTGVIDVLVTLQ